MYNFSDLLFLIPLEIRGLFSFRRLFAHWLIWKVSDHTKEEENKKITVIKNIKINELHDFEKHPFRVENDKELFELMKSIEEEGVLVPLLARSNPNGDGFVIIAGHRRKEVSKWAGIDEVPVIIKDMDDNQVQIAFRLAVEISFLKNEEQRELFEVMDLEQCTPTVSQAQKMKRMSQEGTLDVEQIYQIMEEEKQNQIEMIKIRADSLSEYFPKNFTVEQKIKLIEKLVKEWNENAN